MEVAKTEKVSHVNTCRLCTKDGGLVSIFHKEDSVRLCDRAMLCAHIKISEGDGLPELVCCDCSSQLLASHRFRLQCEASDRSFRALLLPKIENINQEFEISFENHKVKKEPASDEEAGFSDSGDADVASLETESDNEQRTKMDREGSSNKDIIKIELEKEVKMEAITGRRRSRCQKCSARLILRNKTQKKLHLKSTTKSQLDMKCQCITAATRRGRGRPRLRKLSSSPAPSPSEDLDKDLLKTEDTKPLLALRLDLFDSGLPCLEALEEVQLTKRGRKKQLHCHRCGKQYGSGGHLQRHLRRSCPLRKTPRQLPKLARSHMCDQCGRTFKQRTVLIQHMRTHTGLKLYSCDLCRKQFTRSAHLAVHMRIHNNIKPYVCETCGRSFTKSSDLGRHRRVHSDARDFSCLLCARTFKRSGDVTSHMRSHTGDRPYKCQQCDKSYTSHSSLQKHCKTHKEKVVLPKLEAPAVVV